MQVTWHTKAPNEMILAANLKAYITKSKFHEHGLQLYT